MEKAGDIDNTGNREHKKPGEAKPIWPRDRRKGKSVRSLPIINFHSIEYVFCWFYYLFGHVASFRFLLQFSAVMLFAMGVYGVTIDIEKRQIDRGVREATLFAMIARTHALPDGKGAGALKPSVEALARDGVAMEEINLSGANLGGAKLAGANFRRADLSGAIFVEADLSGADLRGANLSGAVFIRANLTDADLCEADLSEADLVGAVFEEAYMEKVNLEGAELLVANFSDAHLAGAIVTSANGAYSNFAGADLSNADFGDTELQGALFDRANIGGARLSQSYDLSNTQIEKACAPSDAPPVLPEHLEWTDRRC